MSDSSRNIYWCIPKYKRKRIRYNIPILVWYTSWYDDPTNPLCLAGIVDRVLTQWCADYCIVGSLPTRDGPLCAVCMSLCVAPSFAVLPGVLMYVSYMGELTVWIVFPTVAIHMYRSSPLVPLDSCLTAAACLSSACKCMFIRCVTSQWFGVTSWVCSLRGH